MSIKSGVNIMSKGERANKIGLTMEEIEKLKSLISVSHDEGVKALGIRISNLIYVCIN